MSNDLQVIKPEMNPKQALEISKQIQDFMSAVLVEGEDYGIIPGTGNKPTLYKPGAEKTLNYFGLGCDVSIIEKTIDRKIDKPNVVLFVLFIYRAQVYKLSNPDVVIASCEGSCNSAEEKYSWKKDFEITDQQVPKKYWDKRDMSLIGGKGHGTKKVDGLWFITREGEKIPIENHADQINTIMKMAQKRASVGATISATRASHKFTQDLEDGKRDNIVKKYGNGAIDAKYDVEQPPPPGRQAAFDKPASQAGVVMATAKQTTLIYTLASNKGFERDVFKAMVRMKFGVNSMKDLPKKDVDSVIKWIEDDCPGSNAAKAENDDVPDFVNDANAKDWQVIRSGCAHYNVSPIQLREIVEKYNVTIDGPISVEQIKMIMDTVQKGGK